MLVTLPANFNSMRTINKKTGDGNPRSPRKPAGEKRSYTRKPTQTEHSPRSEDNSKEKSFVKSSKPYEKRESSERKEYRKPSDRDTGSRGNSRRSFDDSKPAFKRTDRDDRRPFSDDRKKVWHDKSDDKPFDKRRSSDRKEYGKSSGSDSGYKGKRTYDDSKPAFKRADGDDRRSYSDDRKKEWRDKSDDKPFDRRRSSDRGSDRKEYGRSSGSDSGYKGKRTYDDSKPAFKRSSDSRDDKPYEKKEYGERKEYKKSSHSTYSDYGGNKRSDDYKPAFKRDDRPDKSEYSEEKQKTWRDKKDDKPTDKRKRTERDFGTSAGEGSDFRGNRRSFDDSKPSFRRGDGDDKRRFSDDKKGDWRDKRQDKPFENDKRADRKEFFANKDHNKIESSEYKSKRRSYGDERPEKREGVRLNKFIATAGICSRREADELIATGAVKINGKVVTELGIKVLPDDSVQYGGETLRKERPVYVLLNKPKGFITTTDDPQSRKTVMELVRNSCKESIYPVGRLDRNTTGLLLLTNDGDLTKKLTHPSHGIRKIYHIELDKPLTQEDFQKIQDGIELEDGVIKVDEIAYIDGGKTKRELGIEIHSGRNRIVRRIFEQLEYTVTKLDRVYFAGLTKKDLPRGRWRFLTIQEVNLLNMLG